MCYNEETVPPDVCRGQSKRRRDMTTIQMIIMGTIILYLCMVIFTGVMIGRRSKKSS